MAHRLWVYRRGSRVHLWELGWGPMTYSNLVERRSKSNSFADESSGYKVIEGEAAEAEVVAAAVAGVDQASEMDERRM